MRITNAKQLKHLQLVLRKSRYNQGMFKIFIQPQFVSPSLSPLSWFNQLTCYSKILITPALTRLPTKRHDDDDGHKVKTTPVQPVSAYYTQPLSALALVILIFKKRNDCDDDGVY
ncbi:hypothetical protein ACTXT7_007866 [Hymenolepis weldensis]